MDEIVSKIGRKNNCTYCGVLRRQAIERGARELGVEKVVTGHNADDVAETIVMNVLRGDVGILSLSLSLSLPLLSSRLTPNGTHYLRVTAPPPLPPLLLRSHHT